MSLTISNIWRLYQTVIDEKHIYYVSIFKLEGIPVRCLTSMYDDAPIAVIMYIIGYGDYIYFDNSLKYLSSTTLPRVLNHCKYSNDYEEKLLSSAFVQASNLMHQINNNEICVCGKPNHGASRCENMKYIEM